MYICPSPRVICLFTSQVCGVSRSCLGTHGNSQRKSVSCLGRVREHKGVGETPHTTHVGVTSVGVDCGSARARFCITLIWAAALPTRAFFNATWSDSCESKRTSINLPFSLCGTARRAGVNTLDFASAIIATHVGQLMRRVTRGHAGRGEGREGSGELGNGKQAPRVLPAVTKQALLSSRTLSSWTLSDFDIMDHFDTDPEPLLPRHLPSVSGLYQTACLPVSGLQNRIH